jgi:glucokinase
MIGIGSKNQIFSISVFFYSINQDFTDNIKSTDQFVVKQRRNRWYFFRKQNLLQLFAFEMDLVAGIDLGGTETKFGLVNRGGELIAYRTIPTNRELNYDKFIRHLSDQIKSLLRSLDGDFSLAGVSVCAPTGSESCGTIADATNLNWPRRVPVRQMLESIFDVPVTVSNDANAAAVGEMLFGAAQGCENFVCITLGTGLGSGIILNGKLITGTNGHAGELGHVTAIDDGRLCNCGRKGCLETYVSARGIVQTVLESDQSLLKQSMLNPAKIEELTPKLITKAAKQGDKLALQAFDYTGKILGKKLADTVAILNPELIILTGGLSKAGHFLLNPTKKYMEEHLLDIYKGSVELTLSQLAGNKTTILGVAAFMWLKLDKKQKISA